MTCIFYTSFLGVENMKKIKIKLDDDLTFNEGFKEFIYNCKVRNLRDGTIRHYQDSYVSITRYFDEDMLIINKNKIERIITKQIPNTTTYTS
jgi:integrase/recombinase XerD